MSRFARLRWRSGGLLQDATTNFRTLGDVPEPDLYGLRFEDLPEGDSRLVAYARGSAQFGGGGDFGLVLDSAGVGAFNAVGRSTAEASFSPTGTGALNGAAEARWGTALGIVNGNFETGDATGWTAYTGTGLVIGAGGPAGSTFAATVGANAVDASGQYIDFPSDVLPYTDAGQAELKIDWSGASFTDADAATVLIEFFAGTGGTGELLGAHASPKTDQGSGTWAAYSTQAWVPAGAQSCRLQIRGVRATGTNNDAYYDNIVGTFLIRPVPHITYDFLLGNETTGWTATVGNAGTLTTANVGVWHNHSTGSAGWEVLVHGTTSCTLYRDYDISPVQLAAVDAGTALLELTSQMIGADTDTCRVWIEALDASDVSLGVVAQSGAAVVNPTTSSTPVRATGTIPANTRTLRLWQQKTRVSGNNDAGASRTGIRVAAAQEPGEVPAALTAAATSAMTSTGRATFSGVLSANATGTFTPRGKPKTLFLVGTYWNGNTMDMDGSTNGSRLSGFNNGEVGAGYPEQGDVIVVMMFVANDTVSPNMGMIDQETGESYTLIDSEVYLDLSTTNADLHIQAMYYRKHTSTTNNSWPTFTATGIGGDRYGYMVQCWRGVDEIEPFAPLVAATGTGTSRPSPGAITPDRDGSVVMVGAVGYLGNSTAYSGTGLQGVEQGQDVVDSPAIRIAAGWYDWVSGTYTPNTWGGGAGVNAAYGWAAATLAIQPAGLDPGLTVLSSAATGAMTAVGASIAASVFSSSASGVANIVSQDNAVTEAVFSAAAVGELLSTGTGINAADMAAAAVGAMNLVTTAIGSGAISATATGAASYAGNALAPGAMAAAATGALVAGSTALKAAALTSAATSAASFPGRATFSADLTGAATSAASFPATAISSGTLTGSAVSSMAALATAFVRIVLAASATSSMAAEGGSTVTATLSASATSAASFPSGVLSEGVLSSAATSLLTGVGAYGGAISADNPRVVATFSEVRRIVVAQEDRVIFVTPQQRTIVVEELPRTIYVGPLPRETIQ